MKIPPVGQRGNARVPIWKVLEEMGYWVSQDARERQGRGGRGAILPMERREKIKNGLKARWKYKINGRKR